KHRQEAVALFFAKLSQDLFEFFLGLLQIGQSVVLCVRRLVALLLLHVLDGPFHVALGLLELVATGGLLRWTLRGLPFPGLSFTGLSFTGLPFTGLPVAGFPLGGFPFAGFPFAGLPFRGLPFGRFALTGLPFGGLTFRRFTLARLSFRRFAFRWLSFGR